MEEKIEIKTETEEKLLEALKKEELENASLRYCLEGVGKYEKDMHDQALKIAKGIAVRDKKSIANIILNMRFGNRDNVSFCEIFELKEHEGCANYEHCTDCIDAFLKERFNDN